MIRQARSPTSSRSAAAARSRPRASTAHSVCPRSRQRERARRQGADGVGDAPVTRIGRCCPARTKAPFARAAAVIRQARSPTSSRSAAAARSRPRASTAHSVCPRSRQRERARRQGADGVGDAPVTRIGRCCPARTKAPFARAAAVIRQARSPTSSRSAAAARSRPRASTAHSVCPRSRQRERARRQGADGVGDAPVTRIGRCCPARTKAPFARAAAVIRQARSPTSFRSAAAARSRPPRVHSPHAHAHAHARAHTHTHVHARAERSRDLSVRRVGASRRRGNRRSV